MLDLTHVTPSNFGRYALQNEVDTNERTQTQQKTTPNNIPPLMSLSISSPVMTTNTQEKSTTPTSVIKENIEPITFPQHSPGPIQRPNKLTCQPNTQSSTFFPEPIQSPSTPDVLVQINHLLHHQNSIATVPPTPNVSNSTTTTTVVQDLPTPNVPWTPFSTNDWSTKYDSTWPTAAMQSPNIPSTSQMQNPFALRQVPKEETTVWPTALGTATPRSTPSNTRTKQTNEWNEMFPPGTASSVDSTKSSDNNWSKFLPVVDSPSVDNLTENKQENEGNNSFWNPMTPSNSSTAWWPKASTDETDDNKDQSRWDFAR